MDSPTPDTTMADLMTAWPAARVVAARRGMACVGCAMAAFETIAEAADAYGFDGGDFIRDVMSEAGAHSPGARHLRRRKDSGSRSADHSRKGRHS